GDLVVDRKSGDGPIYVQHPFVAVVGGIQPAVLEAMRGSSARAELGGDGLLDRFLFGYPPTLPALGESFNVKPVNVDVWEDVVSVLLAEPVPPDGPRLVGLTGEGRQAWGAWTQRLANEVNQGGVPAGMEGVWSKLRGYGGRLALILHRMW